MDNFRLWQPCCTMASGQTVSCFWVSLWLGSGDPVDVFKAWSVMLMDKGGFDSANVWFYAPDGQGSWTAFVLVQPEVEPELVFVPGLVRPPCYCCCGGADFAAHLREEQCVVSLSLNRKGLVSVMVRVPSESWQE